MGKIHAIILGLLLTLASGTASALAPPTFAREVAPILYEHCTSCHRPNEVGPFSLISYDDARKRSRQIAAVTGERVMPPWKPAAGHEIFSNARKLSEAQIRTLALWAEAGAP
ncbi:MAG: ascorbate-dependent monooxygenase, partial [Gemmataceae bacterium]